MPKPTVSVKVLHSPQVVSAAELTQGEIVSTTDEQNSINPSYLRISTEKGMLTLDGRFCAHPTNTIKQYYRLPAGTSITLHI